VGIDRESSFATLRVAAAGLRRPAKRRNFFGDGEDAGLAGNDEEAMRGIAAGPTRPLQAARVDGAIKTVTGHGIGDKSG
jgi:hypothetical protein